MIPVEARGAAHVDTTNWRNRANISIPGVRRVIGTEEEKEVMEENNEEDEELTDDETYIQRHAQALLKEQRKQAGCVEETVPLRVSEDQTKITILSLV